MRRSTKIKIIVAVVVVCVVIALAVGLSLGLKKKGSSPLASVLEAKKNLINIIDKLYALREETIPKFQADIAAFDTAEKSGSAVNMKSVLDKMYIDYQYYSVNINIYVNKIREIAKIYPEFFQAVMDVLGNVDNNIRLAESSINTFNSTTSDINKYEALFRAFVSYSGLITMFSQLQPRL